MPILTSLVIFLGFALILCVGLVQVIWDLSEMSTHASPQMLAPPPNGTGGPQNVEATASESSSAWELRDNL
jgi:hypothetical protein